MSEEPKTPRTMPINNVEAFALDVLTQRAQQAQAAVTQACNDLALAKGIEPAKVRYEAGPDGKSLILIDEA